MTRAILHTNTNNLLAQHIDIDNPVQLSRLNQFERWLGGQSLTIFSANLAEYRDYLLNERHLSRSSVSSHLSTLRGAYQRLLVRPNLRDVLYSMTNKNDPSSVRKDRVDRIINHLKVISNSKHSRVSKTAPFNNQTSTVQHTSTSESARPDYQPPHQNIQP